MFRHLIWLTLVLGATSAFAEDDIKVSTEPFPDSDTPTNVVEATIDAPAAQVWAIVSTCADFSKTMPRISKSIELAREGDEKSQWTARCQVTADLPFPLSDLTGTTLATHTVQPGVKYVRQWSLISGDYHLNNGSWTVVSIDEGRRTSVRYQIRVRPKINLPASWIAKAQRDTLKDLIARLRDDVKQNAAPASAK